MSLEQLVIYVVVGMFVLVRFLADAFKRRRELEMAQQAQEPPEPEVGQRVSRPMSAPPREAPIQAAPRPAAPPARGPERTAARAAGTRRPRPPTVQPAARHRSALQDRATLRRAIEQMAILGPPRSRDPYDA
jgi:hypothetical protein